MWRHIGHRIGQHMVQWGTTWCDRGGLTHGSHMVQWGYTTCDRGGLTHGTMRHHNVPAGQRRQRGRGGSGAEQKVEGGKGGSCLSLSFAERARHETCGKFAKVNRPRTCSGLGTCNGQEVRVGTAGNGGVTHRNGLDISEAGIDLHAAQ